MSETGKYALLQKPPLPAPEKLLPASQTRLVSERPQEVEFSWKAVEGAKRYRLSVWRQNSAGKLEPVWSEELSELSHKRRIEPGLYQWDVRAVDHIDRKGLVGKARLLEIRQPGSLAAPLLLTPSYAQRFQSTTPRPIELKWEEVKGAQAYRVSIYKVSQGGRKELLVEQEVKDEEFEIPRTIESGHYAWEVAAIGVAPGGTDPRPKPGVSASSQFSVKWEGVLRAPAQLKVRLEDDES